MATYRRVPAVAMLVVATAASLLATAGPASAASYRFWTYWKIQGTATDWQFSTQGAASAVPDGAVEGWRFAVSPDSRSAPRPRYPGPSAFSALCGSVAAAAGVKRVAVVVDYGLPDQAPSGEQPPYQVRGWCAQLDAKSATGFGALAFGAAARSQGGLVCGIDGYPRTECGVTVKDPASSAVQSSQPQQPAAASVPPTKATTPGSRSTPSQHPASTSAGTASNPAAAAPIPSAPASTQAAQSQSATSQATSSSGPDEAAPSIVTSPPVASGARDKGGFPVGVALGVAAVLALGIAAFARARRRPAP